MAYITQVTLSNSNRASVDYQSQEAQVSVTYQLERTDTDLMAFVEEKAGEVEQAHTLLWNRIRQLRSASTADNGEKQVGNAPATAPKQPTVAKKAREEAVPRESIPAAKPASVAQQNALYSLFNRLRYTEEQISVLLANKFQKPAVESLSQTEASQLLVEIQRQERDNRLHAQAA